MEGKNMISSRKLLLLGISFLSILESRAMEENLEDGFSKNTFYIVATQEQKDRLDRRQEIASACPSLAFVVPIIASPDEFALAKEYLNISMQRQAFLFKHSLEGLKGQRRIAPKLFELSQRELEETMWYQETLSSDFYRPFRSRDDDKDLEKSYYEIRCSLAENHLILLLQKFQAREDMTKINPHLQEIKQLEKVISKSPEHHKKLKELIRISEERVPALRVLFHPHEVRRTPQPHRTPSKRIQVYREVKENEKILLKRGTKGFLGFQEDKTENYDLYFNLKRREILTQCLKLSEKKISFEDYVATMKKLTEELVGLEKEGIKFKEGLFSFLLPKAEVLLNVEELTNLYRFLSERYAGPLKDPIELLKNSIFMFIHANKLEDALMRTEVLKNLLPESVAQSDNFKSLRASVLALNGQFDEWRGILAKKREAAETKKLDQKQRIVGDIKKQQEEVQQQKAKEEEKKKALITKKVPRPQSMPESQDDFQVFPENCSSSIKEQHAIVAPREKVKTRKPATEPTVQGTVSLTETSPLPIQSPKDYPVSQNALKTYRKIREGNWHFPRKDLYNLFDKLGCRIDIEQGKGDHGTIHLPLTMTIHNTEGIVAILPEFMQKEASNTPLRPLTIPNWDEKWDGRVPPYMRKSILTALEYLGATDETVHK